MGHMPVTSHLKPKCTAKSFDCSNSSFVGSCLPASACIARASALLILLVRTERMCRRSSLNASKLFQAALHASGAMAPSNSKNAELSKPLQASKASKAAEGMNFTWPHHTASGSNNSFPRPSGTKRVRPYSTHGRLTSVPPPTRDRVRGGATALFSTSSPRRNVLSQAVGTTVSPASALGFVLAALRRACANLSIACLRSLTKSSAIFALSVYLRHSSLKSLFSFKTREANGDGSRVARPSRDALASKRGPPIEPGAWSARRYNKR
mmetsp:Transcript_123453/g.348835  ORF Transcript_123453/g.348835 Transcript_123453/m.348835 type:complete len:266 (+) Transcript_123453:1329-2126(+)